MYRLSRRESAEVFSAGRTVTGRYVAVRFLPKDTGPKLLVAVSGKLSPKATVRSTLRRRLRAALQVVRPPRIWGAVMLRPQGKDASSRELADDLSALFAQIT
jgi:ribonuclease P protein component